FGERIERQTVHVIEHGRQQQQAAHLPLPRRRPPAGGHFAHAAFTLSQSRVDILRACVLDSASPWRGRPGAKGGHACAALLSCSPSRSPACFVLARRRAPPSSSGNTPGPTPRPPSIPTPRK